MYLERSNPGRWPRLGLSLRLALGLSLGAAACLAQAAERPATSWALWENYASAYIEPNGRVIDWSADGQTKSLDQAYSLFFALVANDRERFRQVHQWGVSNLAPRGFSQQRPAKRWGRRPDQSWGTVDPEPATGADLWWAYALIEASRLWKAQTYLEDGKKLLQQVSRSSIVRHRGYAMLLPGETHPFATNGEARVSFADLPPHLLLRFSMIDADGPWQELLHDSVALLEDAAPLGRVPDYLPIRTDATTHATPYGLPGSDAGVLVYLWFGIAPRIEATSQGIRTLKGFVDVVEGVGHIPASWTNANGGLNGTAPIGFYGALLPFWKATRADALFAQAQSRLEEERLGGLYGSPARLNNQALVVFGQGFVDRKYAFDAEGKTQPAWNKGPRS